jgi:hypothetical protein
LLEAPTLWMSFYVFAARSNFQPRLLRAGPNPIHQADAVLIGNVSGQLLASRVFNC